MPVLGCHRNRVEPQILSHIVLGEDDIRETLRNRCKKDLFEGQNLSNLNCNIEDINAI